MPQIVEERLASGLQPVRQFVLAQALYNFMEIGIQGRIADLGSVNIETLARDLGLNRDRLRGFLQYLSNERFVCLTDEDNVSLTSKGKEISDFRPWYTLLIGGYAQTFIQLPSTLQADGPYADRNSSRVAAGSCGISRYDALPMTRRLLDKIPDKWRTIVDLGCGDGSYLVDLCLSIPGIRGVGLDPDPTSVEAALRTAAHYGISDRIDVRVGSANPLPDLSKEESPLCFITAFVLQELLVQSGRAAVVEMLRSAFDLYPRTYWIVVEVDHRPKDESVMTSALGLAYYNPYYLIHHITEQRLESVDFWEKLYQDAGLHVLAVEHPDPSYDSLGLKVGFLLTRETSI